MKTLNQTDTITLSETNAGNFQVTDSKNTYCFGDCHEWALRFFRDLINVEKVVKENEVALLVCSEAWGYKVYDKTNLYRNSTRMRSNSAKNLDHANEIYERISRLSGFFNALSHNPMSILEALDNPTTLVINL